MTADPVRLRGHHLLCVLSFVGRGDSAAFVAGMTRVVDRLGRGEPVEIVDGPDDICATLLARPGRPHCLDADVAARDAAALADAGRLLGLSLEPGSRIPSLTAEVDAMRASFAAGSIRRACAGCSWHDVCSGIAAADFAGTRLPGQSKGQAD
jgi:hypothetical protein